MIAKEDENIEDVKERQQQGTLCWEKTLEITGGGFESSKVWLLFSSFLWKEGKWGYFITANTECKIKGDQGTGHIIKSPQHFSWREKDHPV